MRQIDLVRIYSTKTCLIIDDMSEIRGSISRMLKNFGVNHVDTVATGDDAIERCQNKHYDIVLCDYNLGAGKDGQQVLEELRFRNRLNNTSMFIMITAESARDMVLGALEYRPDDYVTKPITQASLRTRLDKALIRHQELYGIKEAIDEKDYEKAIARCEQKLDGNTNYRSSCLQVQAEMFMRTFNHQKAEDIYDDVLKERPVIWAKLGKGKTQLAKKEYDPAKDTFKEIISIDKRIVDAHDLLATTYLEQNDNIKAQQVMQNAVEVSPKSVLRQRRLSSLAKKNDDVDTCLKAYRKTISLGNNSCHESADDFINLTKELAEQSKDDQSIEGKKYAKEAFDVLKRLEKKKYYTKDVKLQSDSIRSRVSAGQGKEKDAEEWLHKAQDVFKSEEGFLKPEASLEFAETLMVSGDKDQAEKVLKQVAADNPDNAEVIEKIDGMSDKPMSKQGLKKVAELTKTGIGCYEQKEYAEAIGVFKDAVSIFSKHVGLNLNLVQVVLAEAKKNGEQPGFENTCRKALDSISELDESDPQHSRYQYLIQEMDKIYPH